MPVALTGPTGLRLTGGWVTEVARRASLAVVAFGRVPAVEAFAVHVALLGVPVACTRLAHASVLRVPEEAFDALVAFFASAVVLAV